MTEAIHTNIFDIRDRLYENWGKPTEQLGWILDRINQSIIHNCRFNRYPYQLAVIGSLPYHLWQLMQGKTDNWQFKPDVDILAESVPFPATPDQEFVEEKVCQTVGLVPHTDYKLIKHKITSIGLLTWIFEQKSVQGSMSYCGQNHIDGIHDWVSFQQPVSFIPCLIFSPQGVYFAFAQGGFEDWQNNFGRIPHPRAYFDNRLDDKHKIARALIALKYFSFLPDPNNVDLFSLAAVRSILQQSLTCLDGLDYCHRYIQKNAAGLDDPSKAKFFALAYSSIPAHHYANRMPIV